MSSLDSNLLGMSKNCAEMLKLRLLGNLWSICIVSVFVAFKVLDLRLKVEPLTETCKFGINVLPARILASSCPPWSATGALVPNGFKA
ncbi:hypothetical protein EDB86DRAFT_3092142 [Lactarius hatsudake]|nr:hypothetical protein EDB86DRAFT_3092142 [Lactarius hatsudake]